MGADAGGRRGAWDFPCCLDAFVVIAAFLVCREVAIVGGDITLISSV